MKELEAIDYIRRNVARPGRGVVAGIGDDCAVLEYTKDKYLLWAGDMLIEGTHFRVKEAGYERIGRKAIAVNMSDIAAMGGEPKYVIVSLGIPKGSGMPAIKGLYKGINRMCAEYGVKVIGGDVNRSRSLVIDVSILGIVEKKRLLRRSGARKGDLVLVTGPVRNGKKEHLDLAPRVKEARHLTKRYAVSSMIDTSDGIAPDMGRVCAESRAGCRIYADAVPLSRGLALEDALYYGESFELLFTMSVREARRLFKDIGKSKKAPKYFVIGEVTDRREGLKLIGREGRVSALRTEGYEHL